MPFCFREFDCEFDPVTSAIWNIMYEQTERCAGPYLKAEVRHFFWQPLVLSTEQSLAWQIRRWTRELMREAR